MRRLPRLPLPGLSTLWVGGCLLGAAAASGAAPLTVRALGSDGQPLAGAVVFLESREARAAARPMQGVEIAQIARQFVPQVTVVTVGTAVSFPNRDSVRHHVFSFSPTRFDIKLYVGTPASPTVFDKPGIAVLGCNIHDLMAAWVVIVETPYHAMADAGGNVRLDVPPGSYRLRSWHAGLPPGTPPADEALAVPAGGATATVKLPLVAGKP